jgi:dephospho-CoA kinase
MLLGLTGGIASGKSTVARLLVERGAVHIDADALVHELYADKDFALGVQALFAKPILDDQRQVDRVALGKIVFNDAEALSRLEKLVHPAVRELRAAKLHESAGAKCIVLEAVKLIEAGHADKCDEVWCVWSEPEIQVQRLMKKRHLTQSEARARLAHQPPLEAKRHLLEQSANVVPFIVIENNGTLRALEIQVEKQWKRVMQDT